MQPRHVMRPGLQPGLHLGAASDAARRMPQQKRPLPAPACVPLKLLFRDTLHNFTQPNRNVQVPQGMHEDQLLDLFRQCGDIAGAHFCCVLLQNCCYRLLSCSCSCQPCKLTAQCTCDCHAKKKSQQDRPCQPITTCHTTPAGHKFLRHTACMFVDFARLEAAVEVGVVLGGRGADAGRLLYRSHLSYMGSLFVHFACCMPGLLCMV